MDAEEVTMSLKTLSMDEADERFEDLITCSGEPRRCSVARHIKRGFDRKLGEIQRGGSGQLGVTGLAIEIDRFGARRRNDAHGDSVRIAVAVSRCIHSDRSNPNDA